MLSYPQIDPVLFDFGIVQIHWYGVMYLLAFVSAWLLARARARQNGGWYKKEIDDVIFYCALGAVLGGRLGYVLFYQFDTFIGDISLLFRIYQGGMSFHGGILGVIGAFYLLSRKYNKDIFEIADFVAPLVPLGLFFGRIGNFINAELWGKITDSPLGMYAPDHTGEWAVRYPSQLYEAFLEGLVLFAIVWFYSRHQRPIMSVAAVFVFWYALFRFIVEFVRVPDEHLGYLAFDWLTMGQLLTIPMFILAFYLWHFRKPIR